MFVLSTVVGWCETALELVTSCDGRDRGGRAHVPSRLFGCLLSFHTVTHFEQSERGSCHQLAVC